MDRLFGATIRDGTGQQMALNLIAQCAMGSLKEQNHSLGKQMKPDSFLA